MRDYHFTPESYLAMMREAVPGYDRMAPDRRQATRLGQRSGMSPDECPPRTLR